MSVWTEFLLNSKKLVNFHHIEILYLTEMAVLIEYELPERTVERIVSREALVHACMDDNVKAIRPALNVQKVG